jgi:hypothetical protein
MVRVTEIQKTECDAERCTVEASRFVYLVVRLAGGLSVHVRLRLCEYHAAEVVRLYDGNLQAHAAQKRA